MPALYRHYLREIREVGFLKFARGILFAFLPDIASGALAAFLAGKLLERQPILSDYLWGIIFAFSPDIDAIPRVAKGKEIAGHKGLPHIPVILFPITLFGLYVISTISTFSSFWFWACLSTLAQFFHLFHDTLGKSEGIQWRWPWDKRQWKLSPLSEKGVHHFEGNPVKVEVWFKQEMLRPSRERKIGLFYVLTVVLVVVSDYLF